MAEVGSRSGARINVRRGADASCVTRAAVEQRYRAARPGGKPHSNQLDALTAMVDWLARCHRTDGPRVHRSFHQITRALERAGVTTKAGAPAWHSTTVKEDRRHFRNTIAKRLNYLVEMGYVESWEPVYKPNGEGSGIVVTLTADVAQLAKAPPIRRGAHGPSGSTSRARQRVSSDATCSPPPTESNDASSAWSVRGSPGVGGGRERAHDADVGLQRSRRDQPSLVDRARAALGARQASAGWGGGARTVAELPWLAEIPPVALARIVLELRRPDVAPTISARWQRRLEAALPRLDRYANFGAGRQGVGLELLLDYCADPEPPWEGARPARSLGAIAVALHRLGRDWRRHDKSRRRRSNERREG